MSLSAPGESSAGKRESSASHKLDRPAVEVLTERRPRRSTSLGFRATGVGLALVAVAFAVWWVAAAVWAVIHIAELIAVAAVFGYGGWKLGVHHGRRHPRV